MDLVSRLKSKFGRPADDDEYEGQEGDAEIIDDDDEDDSDGSYGSYPDYGRHGGFAYAADENEYAGEVLAVSGEDGYRVEAQAYARESTVPLISRDDVRDFLRQTTIESPDQARSSAGVSQPLPALQTLPGNSGALPAQSGRGSQGYVGAHQPAAAGTAPRLYDPIYDAPEDEPYHPAYAPVEASPVETPVRQPSVSSSAQTEPAQPAPAGAPAPSPASSEVSTALSSDAVQPWSSSAATLVQGSTVREMVVVKPASFDDVEAISRALCAHTIVILGLRDTPEALTRRVLDFSFGAASVCGAKVDTVAAKVFVIFFDSPLNQYEILSLRTRGAL